MYMIFPVMKMQKYLDFTCCKSETHAMGGDMDPFEIQNSAREPCNGEMSHVTMLGPLLSVFCDKTTLHQANRYSLLLAPSKCEHFESLFTVFTYHSTFLTNVLFGCSYKNKIINNVFEKWVYKLRESFIWKLSETSSSHH